MKKSPIFSLLQQQYHGKSPILPLLQQQYQGKSPVIFFCLCVYMCVSSPTIDNSFNTSVPVEELAKRVFC